MWIGTMKNQNQANPNEANTPNNQSSLITNHLEGKPNQTQFKPNSNPMLKRPKMNVRNAITKNYEIFPRLAGRKNKPNTNPIQTQFQRGQK